MRNGHSCSASPWEGPPRWLWPKRTRGDPLAQSRHAGPREELLPCAVSDHGRQRPDGRRHGQWRRGMPVTTTPYLPGREIVEYVGEVFGVVVRSRGALPALGAQLKSIVGGELGTMTNLLEQEPPPGGSEDGHGSRGSRCRRHHLHALRRGLHRGRLDGNMCLRNRSEDDRDTNRPALPLTAAAGCGTP